MFPQEYLQRTLTFGRIQSVRVIYAKVAWQFQKCKIILDDNKG